MPSSVLVNNDDDLEKLQYDDYTNYQSFQIRKPQHETSAWKTTPRPTMHTSPSKSLFGNGAALSDYGTVSNGGTHPPQFIDKGSPAHSSRMNLLGGAAECNGSAVVTPPTKVTRENLRLVEQLGISKFGDVSLTWICCFRCFFSLLCLIFIFYDYLNENYFFIFYTSPKSWGLKLFLFFI